MASLVSFEHFWHSRILSSESGRRFPALGTSDSETGGGQTSLLPPVYEPCWSRSTPLHTSHHRPTVKRWSTPWG